MSQPPSDPPLPDDQALMPRFDVGNEVLYWSVTYHQWVEATVVGKREDGAAYDLDVRKGADPRKMRLRRAGECAAPVAVAQEPRAPPPQSQGPHADASPKTKPALAKDLAVVCADPGPLLTSEKGYLAAARPGDIVEVVFIGTHGDEAGWVYANLRFSETDGAYAGF